MFNIGDFVYLYTDHDNVYQVSNILAPYDSDTFLYSVYKIDMLTVCKDIDWLKDYQLDEGDKERLKYVNSFYMELAIDYIRDKKLKCLI